MARIYEKNDAWWLDVRGLTAERPRRPALRPDGSPCETKAEARAALVRLEESLKAGRQPEEQKRRTVADVLTAYEAARASGRKPGARPYEGTTRAAASFGLDVPLASIDAEAILRWKKKIETEPAQARLRGGVIGARKGNKPRAVKTILEMLRALRSLLAYAVREGWIARDPSANIDFPNTDNERSRLITPEELAELVDAIAEPDAKAVVTICYETGMRLGEVAQLRRAWLDRRSGIVALPASATKTERARHVTMTRKALDALEAWERQSPPRLGDDRVFPRKSNRYSGIVSRAKSKLGRDYHLHDARHSAAVRLRRADVQLEVAMAQLGHRGVAMFRRYRNVDDSDLLDARKKLEAASSSTDAASKTSK